MLTGATIFALLEEEHDCKFSLESSLLKYKELRIDLVYFPLWKKHLAVCKTNRKPC